MLDSEGRRRRLPGVDIRPGAVKQARTESGLSLADLAGGRVTRAAIHLIETGRSRPSMPVLEMIAERTGRPVSWFLAPGERRSTADLELEAHLSEIEALTESEDHEAALGEAEELLAKPLPEPAEARLRYFAGRSQVRLRHSTDAYANLTRARQLFEALEDEWMVVEVMDWTAAALLLQDDPSALALQEEALRRCRRLDPVPVQTELRLINNMAGLHAARKEWGRAIELYQETVSRAGEIDSPGRLAQIYRRLGSSYRALGDVTRAVTYTQKAVAYQSLARDRAALCRAEDALGRLLIRQGDLDGAQRHLERALARVLADGLNGIELYVRLGMAELHLAKGEHAAAEAEARRATTAKDAPQALLGAAHSLLGQIRAAAGDAKSADAEFAQALAELEGSGLDDQLIEVHQAFAQVLKDRGDPARALEQMEAAMALTRPRKS